MSNGHMLATEILSHGHRFTKSFSSWKNCTWLKLFFYRVIFNGGASQRRVSFLYKIQVRVNTIVCQLLYCTTVCLFLCMCSFRSMESLKEIPVHVLSSGSIAGKRGCNISHAKEEIKDEGNTLKDLLTWLFINLRKHPPQLASRSVLKYYLIDTLRLM